jgi:hypothetical protein
MEDIERYLMQIDALQYEIALMTEREKAREVLQIWVMVHFLALLRAWWRTKGWKRDARTVHGGDLILLMYAPVVASWVL